MVFAFLIILSCIGLTFMQETKSVLRIESAWGGFNRTERVVDNAIVEKSYKRIKGEALNKKKGDGTTRKMGQYRSLRTGYPPSESSKLNLDVLVKHEGEIKLHPLYETFAAFLKLLYEKNVFKESKIEKIEYRILDELVKQALEVPEAMTLADLRLDDPALAQIFYKMLRGTNQYDEGQGVPPLEDFIKLSDEKSAANLCFASPWLLQALFGKDLALAMLEEEKRKWQETKKYYHFSKEDFQALLMKNPAHIAHFTEIESYIDYSKRQEKRDSIAGRDKKTGIGVEKSL